MNLSAGRIILLSICSAFLLAGIFCIGQLVEVVNAGDVVVIQYLNGELRVVADPGPVGQWFGKVTTYQKRDQLWFSAKADQGAKEDESLEVRFNDGAHGRISGSVAFEMPTAKAEVLKVHQNYGSQDAVKKQLVKTVLEKAIYMTGPMMSSTESYAERRNELLTLIEEQAVRGVYQTEIHEEHVTEEGTNKVRTKRIAKLKLGAGGVPLRADRSPLEEYHIRLSNLSINKLPYDKDVETQITDQQKAFAAIQVALANAKKSEQDAITAEQKGRADAATAKWEQEKVNAKEIALAEKEKKVKELDAEREKNVAITKGEQLKRVAELAKEGAEFTKQEQILLGEGESERRKLVLAADGALQQKLDTMVKIAEVNARALSEYKGNWSPQIMFGGTQASEGGTFSSVSGIQELLQVLTAKTAKELAVDLSMKK